MEILGRKTSKFNVPVCSVFHEKIVGGEICYEANIDKYRKMVGLREALQGGLSLVIDTNEEYDVKNLFTSDTNTESSKQNTNTFLAYNGESKQQSSFSILLKTISNN